MIKDKFKDQIAEDWWNYLEDYFKEGGLVDKNYQILKELSKTEKVYPSPSELFDFLKCSWGNTIVCFITEYPMFDYSISKNFQNISRWIELEAFDGFNLNLEKNLKYMSNQGILSLPMILTRSEKFDHRELWANITLDILEKLTTSFNKILFVIEKRFYDDMSTVITNDYHKVIKLEQGCIKEVNEFVQKEYNIKLDWNGINR